MFSITNALKKKKHCVYVVGSLNEPVEHALNWSRPSSLERPKQIYI